MSRGPHALSAVPPPLSPGLVPGLQAGAELLIKISTRLASVDAATNATLRVVHLR